MALTIVEARKQLELTKPSFEEMNLNKLSFAREMEFAIQAFESNPFLLGTTGIDKVLKNIVLSGLSLNPVLKYAYLVPRKVKSNFVCCVDPSYVGMCKILTDTGSVIGISATIVYEKEVKSLDVQQGMGGHAKHDNYYGFDKPGKAIACYSIAILPNGMKHVELLRPWEWEGIEARSESVKSYKAKQAKGEYAAIPTWVSDREEMIRKTCLKKHYKYLPKTERALLAAHAFELDNEINGIDFEQEQKDRAAANQSNPAGATPDAPFEDAMATDEDYAEIINLISDPSLGEMFHYKPTLKVSAMKAKLEKDRGEGNFLEKSKAEEYIKFLNAEIEFAKAKPTEEPTASPADYEQLYKLLSDKAFGVADVNYEFKTQKLTKYAFMKGIQKMQTENTMTAAKAEQYIKFLEHELTLVSDENT